MGHKVLVNIANVTLPNGLPYSAGASVILSDDQFARILPASLTDGTLTDQGAYPPVQGYPQYIAEQLLNAGLNQLGNASAPARSPISRYEVTTDVAAALVTAQTLFVALPLYAGDVISRIAVKTGATAANGPTHQAVGLYNPAGTLLSQSVDLTSAAWGANTTKDFVLGAVQTVTTQGVYFVGITVTATSAVPSLLCKVLPLVGVSTGILTGQVTLAQIESGAADAGVLPATISAGIGVAASLNVPYVVAH
jgi:hypothetical protein